MDTNAPTRPLPPGTLIEYREMKATVVKDEGAKTLEVTCDGHPQTWLWKFEGIECTVLPPDTDD